MENTSFAVQLRSYEGYQHTKDKTAASCEQTKPSILWLNLRQMPHFLLLFLRLNNLFSTTKLYTA